MCVFAWIYACECRCSGSLEEGVKSPGAGVASGCESAGTGAGNKFRASVRAVSTLDLLAITVARASLRMKYIAVYLIDFVPPVPK